MAAKSQVVLGNSQQWSLQHIARIDGRENLIPEDHLPASFLVLAHSSSLRAGWPAATEKIVSITSLRFISTTGVPYNIVHGKEIKVPLDPDQPAKLRSIRAFDVSMTDTRIML